MPSLSMASGPRVSLVEQHGFPHGDRVLRGQGVAERGGVEPSVAIHEAPSFGLLQRSLEDATGPLGVPGPLARLHQNRVNECRVVQVHPARVRSAEVEGDPVDGFPVAPPVDARKPHPGRDDERCHRAASNVAEEIPERLVREWLMPLLARDTHPDEPHA